MRALENEINRMENRAFPRKQKLKSKQKATMTLTQPEHDYTLNISKN